MNLEELNIEFETKGMCNCVVKIDHPYMQAWADVGAYVMITGGDFWILTNMGSLWIKLVSPDEIHLECIAVPADKRRQGNGGKLMEYVTGIADDTNTKVSLTVDVVTQGGYIGMPHPVVGMGQNKKDKIPVQSLPKWYASKGFVKTEKYTQKNKSMLYTPKK